MTISGTRRTRFGNLAFWYWTFESCKVLLMPLLFPTDPARGTLVNGALTVVFAAFVGLFLLSGPRSERSPTVPGSAKLVALYLAWSGLTLLWTGAAAPGAAAGYWALMALGAGVVYVMLRAGPAPEIATRSLQGMVLGSILVALYALVAGHGSSDQRLGDDMFVNSNYLGNQMALAALGAIYLALRERRRLAHELWLAITGFLVLMLLASLSKTAIGAFAAALAAYFLTRPGGKLEPGTVPLRGKVPLAVMIGGAVVASYGALTSYMNRYLHETQGGEAVATLSGRTDIWAHTWEAIQQNPLWGYGFLSFRDAGPQVAAVRLVHAHNEWLTVWFEKGLVGLLLALLLYVAFMRDLGRSARRAGAGVVALGMAYLAYSLVRGITEASVTSLVFPHGLMVLLAVWAAYGAGAAPERQVERELRAHPASA